MANKLHVDIADLDQAEAERSIAVAGNRVELLTGYAFTPRTATIQVTAPMGYLLRVPLRPLIAVTAVTLNGKAYTGWVSQGTELFDPAAWPATWDQPMIGLTVQYGMNEVPEDIKDLVLELAIAGYDQPIVGVASEAIDDYRVQYGNTPSGISAAGQATLRAYGVDAARVVALI